MLSMHRSYRIEPQRPFSYQTGKQFSGSSRQLTFLVKWYSLRWIHDFKNSARNKADPLDNDCLKLLRSDWFRNLSDKLSNN